MVDLYIQDPDAMPKKSWWYKAQDLPLQLAVACSKHWNSMSEHELPSSNPTWRWKIHYLLVIFLLKPQFRVDFQLLRLITGGYLLTSSDQYVEESTCITESRGRGAVAKT